MHHVKKKKVKQNKNHYSCQRTKLGVFLQQDEINLTINQKVNQCIYNAYIDFKKNT